MSAVVPSVLAGGSHVFPSELRGVRGGVRDLDLPFDAYTVASSTTTGSSSTTTGSS